MKSRLSRLVQFCLACALAAGGIGCPVGSSWLVGTWSGEFEPDEGTGSMTLTLRSDSTFFLALGIEYGEDSTETTISGTYEADSGILLLHCTEATNTRTTDGETTSSSESYDPPELLLFSYAFNGNTLLLMNVYSTARYSLERQ